MKTDILKSTLLSGFFLLFFIVYNIIISSFFFIFKISISKYYVLLALALSIVSTTFLLKKEKLLSLHKFYYVIISIVLPIVIIFISFFLNGKIIDFSYDGNAYHKTTIGLLKNGWNPIYEKAEEFDNASEIDQVYIDGTKNVNWVNHYAMASHIYQANIYAFTNNIECGKSINTLSIIILFLILFSFMALKLNKLLFPFLFGICAITYSVVSAQFLTTYIDLLNYIYLTLLLISLFMLEFPNSQNKHLGFILYFLCLLMTINIKFNTFAYAGIFCLVYYIYVIIRVRKKKLDSQYFKRFTGLSIVGVIVGVLVIGIIYPKNTITNGHPFYPLFGEGKIDIITKEQPANFVNKSSIEKYFISMFSQVENIHDASGKKATLKIPFTIHQNEYEHIKTTDARMSGNGVLFSGIFIISLLIIVLLSRNTYKNHKEVFIMTTIILATTCSLIVLFSESWWARYFPVTYYFVLISLLYLYLNKNVVIKRTSYLLIFIILINNFITFKESVKYSYDLNYNANFEYQNMLQQASGKTIDITTPIYIGAYYDIYHDLKNYNYKIIPHEDNLSDYNYLLSGLMYYKIESE